MANINVLPRKKVYCFRYVSGDRGEMRVSRNSIPRGFSLSRLIRVGQHQITLASLNSNWPDLTQHLVVTYLVVHHEVSLLSLQVSVK